MGGTYHLFGEIQSSRHDIGLCHKQAQTPGMEAVLNFIIPFIALNIPLATKELIKGIASGAVKG